MQFHKASTKNCPNFTVKKRKKKKEETVLWSIFNSNTQILDLKKENSLFWQSALTLSVLGMFKVTNLLG